ncbi:hypothetical protein KAR91_41120 [Candidatus Pacearchaeota archaeon]|nr:hypothetical protein [Candidatus Pacearchaeota archaeon]
MKRPKHKTFKRYSDLIRYSVRHAIHRVDILEPELHAERLMESIKKSDWLQWAGRKLKGER